MILSEEACSLRKWFSLNYYYIQSVKSFIKIGYNVLHLICALKNCATLGTTVNSAIILDCVDKIKNEAPIF
jgi:hypothetical protein